MFHILFNYIVVYVYGLFLLEYIVSFNGYYLNKTRYNYISAVMRSSSIENWKILDRKNAASKYPSDFDVLFVNKNNYLIFSKININIK